MDNTEYQSRLKPASLQLLRVAEALFAERGIEGVSTREIARAAGQKNHSAVAYHFGSMDTLVQEILDLRLLPINRRRQALVDYLEAAGQTGNIRALVGALVVPYAEQLRADPEESHYIGFMSRLCAGRGGEQLMHENPGRMEAAHRVAELLVAAMSELPLPVRHSRLQLLGLQLIAAVADWDARRRQGEAGYSDADLGWLTENLIDMLTAGLTAPVSGPCTKQLPMEA